MISGNDSFDKDGLKEKKIDLHTIASVSPVGLVVIDADKNVVYVNPASEQLFQKKLSESETCRCGEYISCSNRKINASGCGHSVDCPSCPLSNAIQCILVEGSDRIFSGEIRLTRDPDCRQIWIKYQAKNLVIGGQRFAAIAADDITEQKVREERLMESEEGFRTLANSGQALIWTSGLNMNCDYFNQPWLDFTGRTMQQELGCGRLENVHPEDRTGCLNTYVDAFKNRRHFKLTYRIRRHDGEYRWLDDFGCPRYDAKRNFLGYIGHCLDITDRKQTEDQLAGQSVFTQRILDTTDAHIAIVDENGTILAVNRAWRRFAIANQAGNDESKWGVGAMYFRSWNSDDGDASFAKEAFAGLREVQTGSLSKFEISYPCHSPEEERWFFMRVLPMVECTHQVMVVHTNITALKQTEEKLRLISNQLLTIQEKERKRIAIELHDQLGSDLMTLMLTIRSFQNRLGSKQNRLRQFCDETLKQIDAMADNVKRLARDLSPSILEDLGLAAALRWLIREFGRHCPIEVQGDFDEAGSRVPPDKEIVIFRIFQEALTNIGKHARTGRVSIAVKREINVIIFVIQDYGLGFDVKKCSKITTIEKGMGLATMSERAQMLGAKLEIDSTIGAGTTIRLIVPIEKK